MTRDWDAERKALEDERAEAFAEMRRSSEVDTAPSHDEPALPREMQWHENAKEDVRRFIEDRENGD